MRKFFSKKFFLGLIFGVILGALLFGSANFLLAKNDSFSKDLWLKIYHYFLPKKKNELNQKENFSQEKENLSKASKYLPQTEHERKIIEIVKEAQKAVVSIIVLKEMPVYEKYYYSPFEELPKEFKPFFEFKIPGLKKKGTKKEEVGEGTGFFVSSDGLILTNKHVVYDKDAEYLVITSDKKKYQAKVLARDPSADIAILKVKGKNFPYLKLGNSDEIVLGQTVIAIGNALGQFQNTISVGVVSGLGRRITAAGAGYVETVENMIQTDAAINKGNSGGPLLNLKGEVIGINTAMATGAENIGFATPINIAKKDLQMVKEKGKIVIPFLGIRYILVDESVKEKYHLSVNYGALIVGDKDHPGVIAGSPAEKVGLKEGDIILELNGQKITLENSLASLIRKYEPYQKVRLKVLRKDEIKYFDVVLGERSS